MEEKETNVKKIVLIAIGGFVGLLLLLFIPYQFMVSGPKEETLYFEAGYEAEIAKTDILNGPEFLVNMSTLDVGTFDTSVIDTYEINVRHGFFSYTVHAVVRDTEAPVIEAASEAVYVKTGEEISVLELGAVVTDRGSDYSLFVDGETTVRRDERGTYVITLTAIDTYENESSLDLEINFDTAPVIEGYQDYYVVAGTEIAYLDGITAYDDVDGDLTASLIYDASDVQNTSEGEYTFVVSVTDQYGLTTEQEITATVASADVIQELINTHEINRNTQHIIGAYNLYDGGYFEDDDIEARLEYFTPAFVAIQCEKTNSHSRGSGFIVRITDTDIIMFTNNHVVDDPGEYSAVFFDGTVAPVTIVARSGHNVCNTDTAIVSASISSIPQELFDQLMTVHINEAYWETVPEDGTLSLGIYTIADSYGLRGYKVYTGYLLDKHAADDVYTAGEATQYSVHTITGCSGSAVIDGYGNLISMVSFSTGYRGPDGSYTHYFGCSLDAVLEYYEEVMGEPANYQ